MSGSATNGSDYSRIPATVTFLAGSATASVDLTVINDQVAEGTEIAVLTLLPGSDYAVGSPSSATVTIAEAPSSTIVDDGDPSWIVTGKSWTRVKSGFQGDARTRAKGKAGDFVSWDFAGISPGSYRVMATWPAKSSYAKDATYTIGFSTFIGASVRVNQRKNPVGEIALGAKWQSLGIVEFTGDFLSVRLNQSRTGTVVADAVRLVPVDSAAAANPSQVAFAAFASAAQTEELAIKKFRRR